MAFITMTRVDARLVHGQVVARWIKYLNSDRIIVIDDETANDPLMVELFRLATPPDIKLLCWRVTQAVMEWENNQFGEGRAILLFKNILTAEKAWNDGIKYHDLNIGQIPKEPGRKLAYATAYINTAEAGILDRMSKNGVNVYFQSTPDDDQQPLELIIKNFY